MKKLILIFVTGLITTAAFAEGNFTPMSICGDRSLVVDKKEILEQHDRGGPIIKKSYYQLVLKNEEIIRDFLSKGAIAPSELNSKGEFNLNIAQEQFTNTQFYGTSYGRSTVIKILNDHEISLKIFSPSFQGSQLLADFNFNDCTMLNN